jgi:demethylmenaquinone methyltransferase / 2-methoxy-6-polyprenyl-1,4-benzoquinol methylase
MSTPEDGDRRTHFGYEDVGWEHKRERVRGVFDSVADRYDLMNDLMSLGVHRLWKRFAVEQSGLRPGQRALDVAAGTGDLARAFAAKVGGEGHVVMTDINARMLERGRARLLDAGVGGNVSFVQADAERLPFATGSFECVSIGFGLRNVTDKPAAVAAMTQVLKPGGRLLVLEFSQPTLPLLRSLYDLYSFSVLPRLGRLVTGDEGSYRYLAESIRMHPDQAQMQTMMEQAGLERCRYYNLSGGIVALHVGHRY